MDEESSLVCPLIPDFLLNVDKALQTSRRLILEKCNDLNNLIESQITKIDHLDHLHSEKEKKDKDEIEALRLKIQDIRTNISNKTDDENKLMSKIMEAKRIIEKNATNKSNCAEIAILTEKLAILENANHCKKKNIAHDLGQFKMGIFYYKKYLQCNIIFESKDQFKLTFNENAKFESEACQFIRFQIRDSATTFEFVEMYPKLKAEKEMVDRFYETGDIQGFILHFWKALKLK